MFGASQSHCFSKPLPASVFSGEKAHMQIFGKGILIKDARVGSLPKLLQSTPPSGKYFENDLPH